MSKLTDWTFYDLEQQMWELHMETFRHAMVEILSMMDDHFMATRDQARYQYKEKKERTVVTRLGPVTFKRRYYWDTKEHVWVYLLDQALELDPRGQISAGLRELAVLWATQGPSYRDAAKRLQDLFGHRVLSHETIRQLLLAASDALQKDDPTPAPRKEVDIIFIEADGFWTGVQRQGRKTRRKRETHLVVVHEGWQQRQGKGAKADYRLLNPLYIPVISGSVEEIWEQVWTAVAQRYKNLSATQVIINGDLATWIRSGVGQFTRALYQYDRFHLKREARKVMGSDSLYRHDALVQIDQNNPQGLIHVLRQAEEAAQHPERKDALARFAHLIANHQEAVVDYRQRLKEAGRKVPDTWRGMGAAESNVDRFKLRTAKRGRAWSFKGLQAILHLLGRFYEGTLPDELKRAARFSATRLKTEEPSPLSAGKVAKTVGHETLGVPRAGFPALTQGTQGYAKLFRRMMHTCPTG